MQMFKCIQIYIFIFLSASLCKADADPTSQEIVYAFVNGAYTQVDKLFQVRLMEAKTPIEQGQILYLQGRFDMWRGKTDSAYKQFAKAIEVDPSLASYHYWLGRMYGERADEASVFKKPGLARNALKSFEAAVEIDPDHLEARKKLLEYHIYAPAILGGNKDEARRQADEIKIRDVVKGHIAWAIIFNHEKEKDKAETEYRTAFEMFPNHSEAVTSLGLFLNQNNQRSQAIQILETYLETDPSALTVLYTLGMLYKREQRYKPSLILHERSIHMCRDSLIALKSDRGSFTDVFEKAIMTQTRLIKALYESGLLVAECGDNIDQGIASLNMLFQVLPQTAKSTQAYGHYQLGRIYVLKGYPDSARVAFNTALKWNGKLKQAQKALKKLP